MASWMLSSTKQPPGAHSSCRHPSILLSKVKINVLTYFHISEPYLPDIFVWCSYKLPLKEGYVENWSVVVHKLEEVYFECQSIIEASLRPVKLLLRQTDGEELVNVVEHHDEDQVNWGPCGGNEYGVVFPWNSSGVKFINKTKYFWLRLSYEVSSESWDHPERDLGQKNEDRLRDLDNLGLDEITLMNEHCDSLNSWRSQKACDKLNDTANKCTYMQTWLGWLVLVFVVCTYLISSSPQVERATIMDIL